MPESSAVWLVDISKSIESAVGALARANLDAKRHSGRVQLVLVTVTAGMSGAASLAHGMAGKMSFARQLQAQSMELMPTNQAPAEEDCYPGTTRKHSSAEPSFPSARPAITMHTEAAEAWDRGLCAAAVKFKAVRLYVSDSQPASAKKARRLFRKHEASPLMDFPLDLLPSSCTLLIPKADKTISLQGLLNASAPSIETLLLINGCGATAAPLGFPGSRGPSPSRKGLPPLSPRGFTPRLFSPRTSPAGDTGSPHRPDSYRLDSALPSRSESTRSLVPPGLPASPSSVVGSPSSVSSAAAAFPAALGAGSPTGAAAAAALLPSAAAGGGVGLAGADSKVHPPSPRIHFRPFNVSSSFASRSIRRPHRRTIPSSVRAAFGLDPQTGAAARAAAFVQEPAAAPAQKQAPLSAAARAAFVRRMLSPSARRGREDSGGEGDDCSSSSSSFISSRSHFFHRSRGFSGWSSSSSSSSGGRRSSTYNVRLSAAAAAERESMGGMGAELPGAVLGGLPGNLPGLQRQNSFSNLQGLMPAGTCSSSFAVGANAALLSSGLYGDYDEAYASGAAAAAAGSGAAAAAAGAGAAAAAGSAGAAASSAGAAAGAALSTASLIEAAQRAARAGGMLRGRSVVPQSEPLCMGMSASVLLDDSDDEDEEEEEEEDEIGSERGSIDRGVGERGSVDKAGRLGLPFNLRCRPPTPPKSPAARSITSCSIGSTASIPESDNEQDEEEEERGERKEEFNRAAEAFGGSGGGGRGGEATTTTAAATATATATTINRLILSSTPAAASFDEFPATPRSPPPPKTPTGAHFPKPPSRRDSDRFIPPPQRPISPSGPQCPISPSGPQCPTSPSTPRLPRAISNPQAPHSPSPPGLPKTLSSSALPECPPSPMPLLAPLCSSPVALPPGHVSCFKSPENAESGLSFESPEKAGSGLSHDSVLQQEIESPGSISSRSSGNSSGNFSSSRSRNDRQKRGGAARESYREAGMQEGEQEQDEGITFVTGEFSTKYSSSSSLSAWSPARSESSSSSRLFRADSRASIDSRASAECRTFSRVDILQATDHFSPKTILSKTILGTLHKGSLFGSTVAVKRLEHAGACEDEEFQREVTMLSKVRHPHVALMMGQCPEERCIIYEHLSGGSLQERLGKPPAGKPWAPLTWHDRIRVACELASTLVFLHSHDPPIVHGDLRPENILLDRNRRSKVGDVGIAQFVAHGDVLPESWRLSGSVGYTDPTEMQTGEVTRRSDVYALGLIILQLLLGQANVRALHKQLMPFKRGGGAVEAAVEELMCCLDPAAGIWPRKVAERALGLALVCVLGDAEVRPDFVAGVFPELRHVGQWAEAERKRRCPGQDEKLMCPLSKTRMQDPVIAPDGYTYERRFIEDWLKENSVSPKTGKPLPHKALVPNLTVLAFVNS